MLCNSIPALCGHLNASCFFCVFECLVCWVTSVGFQQACHSDCLSWGQDLCESCFSCWWVLMETRIPGGPHIKTRGIVALGFQTNITHFLCCLRDRGHGGLSPEDLPPLSPSTSPPPHPTGAAKSKCQSRRRRCIPLRGQLVVATEGSVACLRIRLFIHDQPIQLKIYFLGAKQKATLGNLWSFKSLYMMTPLSRCSPCFEDDRPAYLQHTAHFSPLWVICSWAWFTMHGAAYETYCSLTPCDGVGG